jgi:23S rRNA pseudouridine1911/1915/1917 synthase
MHQIRVHLQAIGHPVLCDKRYGLRAELRRSDLGPLAPGEEDRLLLSRQALHAHRIRFNHPVSGSPVTIEAPLPPDLQRLLEALRAT